MAANNHVAAVNGPPPAGIGVPDIIYLNKLRTSFLAQTDPPTDWFMETLRGSLKDFYGGNSITSASSPASATVATVTTASTATSARSSDDDTEKKRKEEIIDDILDQTEQRGYRFCPQRNEVIPNTPTTKMKRKSLIRQKSREMLRLLASQEEKEKTMDSLIPLISCPGLSTSSLGHAAASQSRSPSASSHGEWSELLKQTIASETRASRTEDRKERIVERKFVKEISITDRQVRREVRRENSRNRKKSKRGGRFVPCGKKDDVIEGKNPQQEE